MQSLLRHLLQDRQRAWYLRVPQSREGKLKTLQRRVLRFSMRCACLILFCILFWTMPVKSDQRKEIEDLLSYDEIVGVNLEGRKNVSAELESCELHITTTFGFPDPNPVGVRKMINTLDLTRVGSVEQYPYRGRTLLKFRPHGFGSPFRSAIDLEAQQYAERWDREVFSSTKNLGVNFFLPQEGRNKLARLLRRYIREHCKEERDT